MATEELKGEMSARPLAKPRDVLLAAAADAGCMDMGACGRVLDEAVERRRPMVAALLDYGQFSELVFLESVAKRLGLPWLGDNIQPLPAPLRERFPVRVALRHHLLPQPIVGDELSETGGGVETGEGADEQLPRPIYVATYDPFDLFARQTVNRKVKGPCIWGMATRRQILESLRQGYGIGAETFEELLAARGDDVAVGELRQETTVLDMDDSEASVVKFVNQIIREALRERATDIHIEPLEDDLRIRYRIDGVLHEIPVPGQIKLLQSSVLSRLKIMADLDIAERRLPQDGRINLEFEGRPIDVRVATIPSVTGESISLRLLGQQRFTFDMLGLDEENARKVRNLLQLPNGIILLTGPTGCGKSTSLYAFLSTLNTKDRRIVTIEDPVEQKLEGVIQIAVRPEINLTFASGLRSILRGDPNVVMVGEMRDLETTEIAIRAALTGHLVFSTLHTNDAIGGITRLLDMGVEPFLVSSSVRAFLAQRLVRVLCPQCRAPADYPTDYLAGIGFPVEHADKIRKAVGCERCRFTGYMGRRAIMEICVLSKRLEEMITAREPGTVLRPVAIAEGMVPLRQDGWRKVIAGETTIEEVLRVTVSEMEAIDE